MLAFLLALVMIVTACPFEKVTYAASKKIKATISCKAADDGVKLTVKVTYHKYDISYIKYKCGDVSKKNVAKSGKKLTYDGGTASVVVKSNDTYTFVIRDKKGNMITVKKNVTNYSNPKYSDQYKAVWFAYYDYSKYLSKYSKNNETNFRTYFKTVINNCKKNELNTIIVHVRAFGDAMYDSEYFPTSKYIAGTQGKKLSYDPLKVMVEEAHKKNIKIEAWINPYRVSADSSYAKLSNDHPAKKWHNSSSSSTQRNVLSYKGKLYFNPAKEEVRELIINGVREIVENYDVDGIHMDDYFYPSFSSSNYKTAFDAKEYNDSQEKKNGMSIVEFRREQVDLLVKGIKSAISEIDSNVVFGISPAGNIDNLKSKYSYYVDIQKWVTSTEYVDYITPQIYWGFNHSTAKFNKVLDRWKKMTDQSKVKLYIGLPVYRMGGKAGASNSKEMKEWKTATTLKKMIRYGRSKNVDGFTLFDYEDLVKSSNKSAVSHMRYEFQ
jgi:uncharacterized lipoprotein YddW (UPF0748 family)